MATAARTKPKTRSKPAGVHEVAKHPGGLLCEIELRAFCTNKGFQRPVREYQIQGFENNGGFAWKYFGCPVVTMIDGKPHIIEGQTRTHWLYTLCPDGVYTKDFPDIPVWAKPGDPVVVTCLVIDSDPVVGAEKLNDTVRMKLYQKFNMRRNSPLPEFDAERQVAAMLTRAGIQMHEDNGRVKADNTTNAGHVLARYYRTNARVVQAVINIIDQVYRHPPGFTPGVHSTIEHWAMTQSFIHALCDVVLKSEHSEATIQEALKSLWHDGMIAESIYKACRGTGGGASKTRLEVFFNREINKRAR